MLVEADGFVKEGAAVVDDGIDAAELLEDLDGTGNEEASARVELVRAEDVFPGAGIEFGLNADGFDDVGMQLEDLSVRHLVPPETAEDDEGFLLATVGGEPARSLGEDPQEDEHGGKEDDLQNARDTPGEGGIVVGEGEVDPVHKSGGEVERGQLHAYVYGMSVDNLRQQLGESATYTSLGLLWVQTQPEIRGRWS